MQFQYLIVLLAAVFVIDAASIYNADGEEIPMLEPLLAKRLASAFNFQKRNETLAKREEFVKRNETLAKRDEPLYRRNETLAKRDEPLYRRNETLAKRAELLARGSALI